MTGILLIQLGTPDAPTVRALRPYLRQFLSDPRVVETRPYTQIYIGPPRKPRRSPSGTFWNFFLNGVIVPFRSLESAKKYARIWGQETGSPLMHHTIGQVAALQQRFGKTPVRFGMMVGNPSVEKVVTEMVAEGVDRIIAIPMFPQYSGTTSASAMDSLCKILIKLRVVPAVRTVPPYYNHPSYLDAMAAVIQEDLAQLAWEPEHYVFSFHGIPQKYAQRGDPYAAHCVHTTRGLVERLGWKRDQWTQTYQSRLGRIPWLKPYTDPVLKDLAARGVKRVAVILPGFTADCLETIDEIGTESRELFEHAGGEHLHAVPCLNTHPQWIDALETILREEGQGWLPVPQAINTETHEKAYA
jgi:ferrochelatase